MLVENGPHEVLRKHYVESEKVVGALQKWLRRWNPEKLEEEEYTSKLAGWKELQTQARVEISEAKILDLVTSDLPLQPLRAALHKVRGQMASQSTPESRVLPVVMDEVRKCLGSPL